MRTNLFFNKLLVTFLDMKHDLWKIDESDKRFSLYTQAKERWKWKHKRIQRYMRLANMLIKTPSSIEIRIRILSKSPM